MPVVIARELWCAKRVPFQVPSFANCFYLLYDIPPYCGEACCGGAGRNGPWGGCGCGYAPNGGVTATTTLSTFRTVHGRMHLSDMLEYWLAYSFMSNLYFATIFITVHQKRLSLYGTKEKTFSTEERYLCALLRVI